MAIKYKIEYCNRSNDDFKIEIDLPDYEGDIVEFVGVGAEISHDNTNDDPFNDHVISSQASVTFILPPEKDIEDLQLASDLTVKVKIYKNEALFWSGFLINDGLQELFKGYNAPVTITASDGLRQLEGLDFDYTQVHAINMPEYTANFRCLLGYIEGCVKTIGNELDIIWNCEIRNENDLDKDFLAGITEFDTTAELSRSQKWDCYKFLDGILKSANLTIQQVNGIWYVQDRLHVNKESGILKGYKLIDETAISYTEDLNKEFTEIEDNTVRMVKKAISTVEMTYKNVRNENIVPNGSFNLWNATAVKPLYWSVKNGINEIGESITGRLKDDNGDDEVSVKVKATESECELYLDNWLNFDAHKLFKRFTLGFTFMPSDFPTKVVDGQTLIDWDNAPLRMEIKYTAERNDIVYDFFLNENGYWVRDTTDNLKFVESIKLNNDYDCEIVLVGRGMEGQKLTIKQPFRRWRWDNTPTLLHPQGQYRYSSLTKTTEIEITETFETIEETIDFITSTYGYEKLSYSSFKVKGIKEGERNEITKQQYDDQVHLTEATITNSTAVTTTNYIQIMVDQMKNGDIAALQFTSKGNQGRITIPDPNELRGYNNNGRGRMYIKFILPNELTACTFEDVYFNVDDNNDKYILKLPALKDSVEQIEMEVSSSFSGFLLSSYMTDYSDSDVNMLYSKDGFTGTLTEHYGRDILRWRSQACRVIDTTLNGYVRPIDYIEFYGQKFVPLSIAYNTESDTSTVTLFEIKTNDLTNMEITHEATNKIDE